MSRNKTALWRSRIESKIAGLPENYLGLALALIDHACLWGEIGNTVLAIDSESQKGCNVDAFDCNSLVAFQAQWGCLTPKNQVAARAYFLSKKYREKLSLPIIKFLESLPIGSEDENHNNSPSPGDDNTR